MGTEKQAALIMEIGELIVEDPGLAPRPWHAVSIVTTYDEDSQDLTGYLYDEDGGFEAITLENVMALMDKLDDLRDAMEDETGDAWVQCLMQITKPKYEFRTQYEYTDAARWSPAAMSSSMQEFADALRPETT